MSKVVPIYKCEAYLIPTKYLEPEEIAKAEERFLYRFYDEKRCRKCEYVTQRHTDTCDSCAGYTGARATAKIVEKGSRSFLSLPVGASKKVHKWLTSIGKAENIEVIERHADPIPFSRPIKLTRSVYDYQQVAVKVMLKKKRGILCSPPRTGKTVMGTAVVCAVGEKTLILGAQLEWLKQFRDTFLGTETQVGFTNAKPRQVKLCKTLRDFQTTDVALATFSSFMSANGKKLLEQIREMFSVVIIDEVHFAPALQTSRIVSRFNARYYLGMSGTVERKVTDEIQIAHDLVGPIIHTCEVERSRARLVPFFPGVKLVDPKGGQTGFTSFQTRLESNSVRRAILIKEIIRLAKSGHLVLVPLSRVDAILKWTQEINREMERPGFALPFFGGLKKHKRDEVVQAAREFKCRVLVGNISLLSVGLNIPRASCIFEIGATSNAPKAKQRLSRILTPMDDKPQPLIYYVLDDSDLMMKCRRSEFWGVVKPVFDPIISRDDMSAIMGYFGGNKGGAAALTHNLKEGI